jgi:hypothetical protein
MLLHNCSCRISPLCLRHYSRSASMLLSAFMTTLNAFRRWSILASSCLCQQSEPDQPCRDLAILWFVLMPSSSACASGFRESPVPRHPAMMHDPIEQTRPEVIHKLVWIRYIHVHLQYAKLCIIILGRYIVPLHNGICQSRHLSPYI